MGEAVLRCKMHVQTVKHNIGADGAVDSEEVSLQAVYGPEGSENARWARYTPSASFNITIGNPEAIGHLSKGHEFYVDFVPVPKA